jgi:hypothetical protein
MQAGPVRCAPTESGGASMKRQNVLPVVMKNGAAANPMKEMVWRLFAEDNDRLVRIVAEDRDVIRRELLRKHEHRVRVRKHLRDVSSKVNLDT